MSPKVICLGLSKTGTTSFGECMKVLGYRHLSGFDIGVANHYLQGDLEALDTILRTYDSVDDWPWPALFQRIAVAHPDAKFVLTMRRDPNVWLQSYRDHCMTQLFRFRGFERYNCAFFGASYPFGQEAEHLAAYARHAAVVRDYFRDEPDRLLELCLETDPVWTKLCAFLGVDEPDVDVPRVNVKRPGKSWRRVVKKTWMTVRGRVELGRGIVCHISYAPVALNPSVGAANEN